MYNSSGPVSYLYDPSGQFFGGNWANGAGWNAGIHFGSRLMAMYGGDGGHTAYFTHANALGSETQTTDYPGNGGQAVLYFPWGEKMSSSSSLYGSKYYQVFASLLLYHTATDGYVPPDRYYIPEQGRWLTADPGNAGADPSDPQTWNPYAYARNNPTTLTDPTGEVYQVCQSDANGNQTNCANISDQQFAQFQQANKDTLAFTGGAAGNLL